MAFSHVPDVSFQRIYERIMWFLFIIYVLFVFVKVCKIALAVKRCFPGHLMEGPSMCARSVSNPLYPHPSTGIFSQQYPAQHHSGLCGYDWYCTSALFTWMRLTCSTRQSHKHIEVDYCSEEAVLFQQAPVPLRSSRRGAWKSDPHRSHIDGLS